MIAVPLENKIGAGYSNPMDFDGPLEFLAGQGTIGQEEEGDLFIHMHCVLSDKDGNVHGGHLIKGKNPVLATCEIMISHVEDVRMIRTYDPEIEMFDKNEINDLGYDYLNQEMVEDAIKVFQLFVMEYPEISNSYDSLGEAYAKNSDIEKALQNYRKALEINPYSQSASRAIERLEAVEK